MNVRPQPLCATLLLTLLSATAAFADHVSLRTGRSLTGEIIAEDADSVTLRTDAGITTRILRRDIAAIEAGATPADLYEERAAKAETAADHRALARFCQGHKLRDQATRQWRAVIALHPDDREARRELGYVRSHDGWRTREAYMKELGLVRHKGRWLSIPERDLKELAAARSRDRSRCRTLLRRATSTTKNARRDAALKELGELSTEAVCKPFATALVTATTAVRALVLSELERRLPDRSISGMLARSALSDPKRLHRRRALRALSQNRDPDSALYFRAALYAENPLLRVNATHALMQVPDTRVVRDLIVTLRMSSGGFGRGHFSQLTQRAYIRDFALSSGGSGLTVAEVADPVIGSFAEGVVLDADIINVEWTSKARVLEYLTGQSFGTDQGLWTRWWTGARDSFELADAARALRATQLGS